MTDRQRELARHALGLPNQQNTSYRNRFCAGLGHGDYADWLNMVEAGYAVRQTGTIWGDDEMFYLTLKGALLARDKKEHLSAEDTKEMHRMSGAAR